MRTPKSPNSALFVGGCLGLFAAICLTGLISFVYYNVLGN